MITIINSFAQFMPAVFILCVVAVLWDIVIGAFTGGRL